MKDVDLTHLPGHTTSKLATANVANHPARPILDESEVIQRVMLLAELQVALVARGMQSLLVRNRRIVLRSAGTGLEPSGPTNPQLHIFQDDGTEIATTDGTRYEFATRLVHPVADPQAVAESLASHSHAHRQAQPR